MHNAILAYSLDTSGMLRVASATHRTHFFFFGIVRELVFLNIYIYTDRLDGVSRHEAILTKESHVLLN